MTLLEELRWLADGRRAADLIERITEGARWCGAVHQGIGFNVNLWDLPNCDGRRGKTLIEAAQKGGGV